MLTDIEFTKNIHFCFDNNETAYRITARLNGDKVFTILRATEAMYKDSGIDIAMVNACYKRLVEEATSDPAALAQRTANGMERGEIEIAQLTSGA